jgi:hypothetical protein
VDELRTRVHELCAQVISPSQLSVWAHYAARRFDAREKPFAACPQTILGAASGAVHAAIHSSDYHEPSSPVTSSCLAPPSATPWSLQRRHLSVSSVECVMAQII